MPRLIILVLISAAIALLAFGNTQPVSLVVLGSSRTPEIPFGLLLAGAVIVGSLITLFLYGLVGLIRPPESKYRPMGRRVPYPDSPESANFPASGSSPYATAGTPTATSSSGRSTAFVSDSSARSPQDSFQAARSSDPAGSYATPDASPKPLFNIGRPLTEQAAEKKKSERSSKVPLENRPVGEDWGELRSAESRDSWNLTDESERTASTNGNKRGLWDFIGIGSSAQKADRLAYDRPADDTQYRDNDLDSGWENFEQYEDATPVDRSGKRVYRDGLYGDEAASYGDSDRFAAEAGYPAEDYPEQGYPADDYLEEGYLEEDYEEENVYEADYRVIVPPSKESLERDSDQGHA